MRTLKRSLPFAVALIVPALCLGAAWSPSLPMALAVPLVIFVVFPVLDLLCGRSVSVVSPDGDAAARAADWRFDVWLWAWVPLQVLVLVGCLRSIAYGVVDGSTSVSLFVAGVVACGLTTGMGINVAHELMHRRGRCERALAELLMATTTYTHFCVEHVHGHHKNVATPLDPASCQLGESLYAYLPRTLLGGLRSAWHIETARVRRTGDRGTWRDRRLRYPLTLFVVYGVVGLWMGIGGVCFFALQSLLAMLLLETINYIEHYGLSRREIRPGVYERTTPHHSWNASERLTNWVLFQLQRHADHHHLASRPYFALRHIEDSPQLPTGYAGMVLLALVPPVWRHVMHPRVAAWQARRDVLERAEGEAGEGAAAEPST
jgi:alkane 1-monooxygenase